MTRQRASAGEGAQQLEALTHTVAALTQQVSLAMEVLTLLRADQMRLMEQVGLLQHGEAPHRCVDPEHHHPPAAPARRAAAKRKTGGRHGG